MTADDIIKIIDHVFWMGLLAIMLLTMLGFFDRD